MLIWDLEVHNETDPLPPLVDYEGSDPHAEMPWLDIRNCHCNCFKYPERGRILQNFETDENESSEEENNSTQNNSAEPVDSWIDDDFSDNYSQYSDSVWENPGYDSANENGEISDVDDDGRDEDVTHTLPFKVIGVAHCISNQNHLEKCMETMNEHDVQVRVLPEPDNEKDKDAISVQVNYCNDEWHHVGYIASELTHYVHSAMQSERLSGCRIEHIKFRVHFCRPGFYMKLLLTKRGEWEPFVIQRSKRVH